MISFPGNEAKKKAKKAEKEKTKKEELEREINVLINTKFDR